MFSWWLGRDRLRLCKHTEWECPIGILSGPWNSWGPGNYKKTTWGKSLLDFKILGFSWWSLLSSQSFSFQCAWETWCNPPFLAPWSDISKVIWQLQILVCQTRDSSLRNCILVQCEQRLWRGRTRLYQDLYKAAPKRWQLVPHLDWYYLPMYGLTCLEIDYNCCFAHAFSQSFYHDRDYLRNQLSESNWV